MVSVMQKCLACEEHQQQLLEDGDGSQVLCTHSIEFSDGEEDEKEEGDIPVATASSSTTSRQRKRKFLSPREFNDRADDKTKRRIAPIQEWRNLIIGNYCKY